MCGFQVIVIFHECPEQDRPQKFQVLGEFYRAFCCVWVPHPAQLLELSPLGAAASLLSFLAPFFCTVQRQQVGSNASA